MLGHKEAEKTSIAVIQALTGSINKVSGWPTVVERIADLECRIPTIAVLLGPIRKGNLNLGAATHWIFPIDRVFHQARLRRGMGLLASRACSTRRWWWRAARRLSMPA